jgi:hypothetical protein
MGVRVYFVLYGLRSIPFRDQRRGDFKTRYDNDDSDDNNDDGGDYDDYNDDNDDNDDDDDVYLNYSTAVG